jgi:hypothetical protein
MASKLTCKHCRAKLEIPTCKPKYRIETTLRIANMRKWVYLGAGIGVCADCNMFSEEIKANG